MSIEYLDAFREELRHPLVIGIKESEDVAAGFLDAGVARGSRPSIILLDQADAAIAIPFDDSLASIRRSIVNDEDFNVAKSLRRDGVERARYVWRFIVEGDDD